MKLQEALAEIQAELDKKAQKIEAMTDELNAREQDILQTAKVQEEKELDLKAREAELSSVESIVDLQKSTEKRIQEAILLENQAQTKLNEARLAENRLVEIQAGLKQREEEVAKRERTVSDKEIDYKARVRKEFFEEVQKGLPR